MSTKDDATTVSPNGQQTDVIGSELESVSKSVFDEVCQNRDKLKKECGDYYKHIEALEKQIIEMIRLRKKEYFNFIAQLNAIKLFFDVTEKGSTHRQKELFSRTAKGVIDAKTEELIRNFNDYRFRVNRSVVFKDRPQDYMFSDIPNDDPLPF